MATTGAKGTKENPYSMDECDSMLEAGTWPGGFVRDDAGTVSYVMMSVTIQGYSGTGCGRHGSDYEFCTGSFEWHEPDTDNMGCDDEGKVTPPGSGSTSTGGNSSGAGGGSHGGGNSSTGRLQIINTATKYLGRNETNDIELIKTWLRNAGYPNPTNSTAWCAAFAYNMFQEAGYEGYKSSSVGQWREHYGVCVQDPKIGDVVFFANMSHIGIVAAVNGNSITVIHGNWSNKVSKTVHDKSYFDAFKRGK